MTLARTALLAALFVAGVFVAICSLVVHRHAWWIGDVAVPWGLVLCLAVAYVCTRSAGLLGVTTGAAAFGLAWLAVLLATYSPLSEGDYLIAADVRGYAYLIGSIALVGTAVVRTSSTPARNRRD